MVTIPYWFIRYGLPAGFLLLATVAILFARNALHDDHAVAATRPAAAPQVRAARPRPKAESTEAYSVRSGDTLGTIAERFGTTVDGLLALNPGIDPRALRVGETLRVSR
jgi:Tfp pilus assembly protein FimV